MTPGTLLASRYELVEELGRGGMAHVWLAVDRVLDRRVAVKTVDLHAADDPAAAERFRREAKAAAALSHDHVVTIFDSGTDGQTAYLVMQLLPGPTLDEVIRARGPLPVAESLAYAEQAASALAATHRVGIVHRDIKPGNLMFDDQGRLQVVDFGIARLTEAVSAQLTAASTVVGSVAYMAPEQADGRPATPATDLYALGCVLMAMLTGRPPFEAEHPLGALQQHLSAPPPRVRERRPDVPEQVDLLVDRLLAKAPEARPAGAEQLVERLRALRAGIGAAGIGAAGVGAVAGAAAAATGLDPAASTLAMPPGIVPAGADDPRDASTQVLAPAVGAATEVQPAPGAPTRVLPPAADDATRVPPPASGAAAGRPLERPRRRLDRRLLIAAAAVIAVVLLALLLPPLLGGIGGTGEQSAESQGPQPAATADEAIAPTAPTEPAPAAPADEPAAQPAAVTPAEALAQLRAAVDQVAATGGGEEDDDDDRGGTRDDLVERVDDIEQRMADGRLQDLANKLEDLAGKVDELEREGRLTATDADAVRAALAQLTASIG